MTKPPANRKIKKIFNKKNARSKVTNNPFFNLK